MAEVLRTAVPRYLAMDRHFARGGPEGRTMMCSTASVQVCLDAGADDAEIADRWHALHAWLPVLTALFANSPTPGRRCTRAAVWGAIDPTRTSAPVGPDPRSAYGRWALDAQLLAVRREAGSWSAPAGLTFRDWLRGRGPGLPAPTWGDLDYHLTTLFPPVRPRGYVEIRCIDALPDRWWPAVAAVTATLVDDPVAADLAAELCAPAADDWEAAARSGTAAPAVRRAVAGCLDVAARRCPPPLKVEVAELAELFDSGRTPSGEVRRRVEAVGPLRAFEEEAHA